MTLFGIDVSVYQAGISWHNVAAAGMEYSVARASIGLRVDATFQSHRAGAQGAGLIAGAYHFLEPGSGSDQADVFMAATNKCHGILAALDCEASGLTIGNIRLFVDRFKAKTGGHPLFIYTGISFWGSHGNPSIKDLGPLWLAYYPGGGYPGDDAATWDRRIGGVKPTIWQYGPRPIKGRSPVDGDAFRGTRAELEAFIGGTSGSANIGDEPMIKAPSRLGSGDVVEKIPAGTDFLDGPGGARIGDCPPTMDYAGLWGPDHRAVIAVTGIPYADKVPRATIVAIAETKGTVRGKTDAELKAQAAEYHECPPAAPAPTPNCDTAVSAEHERTLKQAKDALEALA